MIYYFDASALVKRYIQEDGSDRVEGLLQAGIAATSRQSHVEILSAASRRWREGDVSSQDHQMIVGNVRRDFDRLTVVEITRDVVDESERLLVRHALRAGDAIQLASCIVLKARSEAAVMFAAFDARCTEAALVEGLRVDTA